MITAVITNTRPQRVFSSVQTCVLVDVNQPLPWFFTLGLEKIPSPFLEHSEEYVGVSAVVALFCYSIWHRFMSRLREEYEFVECLRQKKTLQGRVLVVTAVINELIVVNFYLFTQGFKPPMLIFVQSRERAKELFHELIYDGINVDVIHSDRTQAQVRFL